MASEEVVSDADVSGVPSLLPVTSIFRNFMRGGDGIVKNLRQ